MAIFSGNAYILGDEDQIGVKTNGDPLVFQDAKKFVADLPKLFKNVKSVILNVFGHTCPQGYKTNMDFCEAVKEKLVSLQIPHMFLSTKASLASFILLAANIKIGFNEICLIVIITSKNRLIISEYEYTQNGYKPITERNINFDIKDDSKALRDSIMGTSNPKKIILTSSAVLSNSITKYLRMVLKSKKLIAIDSLPGIDQEDINELAKWLFDKSYAKYYIIPTYELCYFFVTKIGQKLFPLQFLERSVVLPYDNSIYISRCNEEIIYGDLDEKAGHKIIEVNQKCHQNKVTVTVDDQSFIKVKLEAIIYPQIETLPEKLNKILEMKLPIIGILNGISVICVYEENEYKFLDAWNGLYGKELSVLMKINQSSLKKLLEFYLINHHLLYTIMSMPPDDITVDEKWKFTVTKDENYPVLLEFDTFEGTSKLATPAFLMAIIRQHLKAIKTECGEKPAEIGFCVLDDFTNDEKERVEKQLKESCELLKIQCFFVNV